MSVSTVRSAMGGAAPTRDSAARQAGPARRTPKRFAGILPAIMLLALLLPGAAAFASPPAPSIPRKGAVQGNWVAVPPMLYGRLYGVYALSPTDIWAVGSKALIATTGTLIMHYDGTTWSEVTSIPWVHDSQRLNSISASGPGEAWAVGIEGPKTIALHWDGANWSAANASPPAPEPLPTPAPHCQAVFSDVSPDQSYYPFVNYLYCRGIMQGYEDGTFRPDNPVTRGQLAQMAVAAFNLRGEISRSQKQHFSDVPPGSPLFPYVEAAYAMGFVSGDADGNFHPDTLVTRGELAKVVTLAANTRDPNFWQIADRRQALLDDASQGAFSDVPPGSPFYPFIQTAAAHSAVSAFEDGTFRPQNTATRAEVAAVLYMALFSAPAYSLNGVVTVSSSEAWAAGTDGVNPLVMRYNGTTWEQAALPAPLGINGTLSDIEATPAGLVAVGSYTTALPDPDIPPLTTPDRSAHSLMLKYDAGSGKWSRITPPGASLPASALLGLASVGGSAWAVGTSESDVEGVMSPMLLTSTRPPDRWSIQTAPADQGGTTLAATTGTGPADIWTSGWSGTPFPTLPGATMYAAHYDGAGWDLAALPDMGTSSRLMGIASVSANNVWAVGYAGQGPNAVPVILHYVGASARAGASK